MVILPVTTYSSKWYFFNCAFFKSKFWTNFSSFRSACFTLHPSWRLYEECELWRYQWIFSRLTLLNWLA